MNNDKIREALEKIKLLAEGPHPPRSLEHLADIFCIAEEALSLDPWQPIETAPKDGTEFLAINNGGYQFVVWWNVDAFQCIDDVIDNLTHWQPLPAPPKKD